MEKIEITKEQFAKIIDDNVLVTLPNNMIKERLINALFPPPAFIPNDGQVIFVRDNGHQATGWIGPVIFKGMEAGKICAYSGVHNNGLPMFYDEAKPLTKQEKGEEE